MSKWKQRPEASPLRFWCGELQKRSRSSEQRLVGFHTVGNLINKYSSKENIKRDEKDIQSLSESRRNTNLGVTMREKESLVVRYSPIVVF